MASKEGTYGIQEIWRPETGIPQIDIVAVHGLNGDARRTWTARKRQISWLKHPEFLPKYVQYARVLVWGYNASFSSLTGAGPSADRIQQHAHTLVAHLTADRKLAGMSDKPIVFLCHSLGGIVVKRALVHSQTRTAERVSHEYNIFAATHAILFFGTPHEGSQKANYLSYMLKIMSRVGPAPSSESRSDLVSALEYQSETLQTVADLFIPIMKNFKIFFFWEQMQTNFKIGKKDFIVSRESAAPLYDDTERAGIAADHSGLVKFEEPSDPGFKLVAEALMRYCMEALVTIPMRLAFARKQLAWERHKEALELGMQIQGAGAAVSPSPPHDHAEYADLLWRH